MTRSSTIPCWLTLAALCLSPACETLERVPDDVLPSGAKTAVKIAEAGSEVARKQARPGPTKDYRALDVLVACDDTTFQAREPDPRAAEAFGDVLTAAWKRAGDAGLPWLAAVRLDRPLGAAAETGGAKDRRPYPTPRDFEDPPVDHMLTVAVDYLVLSDGRGTVLRVGGDAAEVEARGDSESVECRVTLRLEERGDGLWRSLGKGVGYFERDRSTGGISAKALLDEFDVGLEHADAGSESANRQIDCVLDNAIAGAMDELLTKELRERLNAR